MEVTIKVSEQVEVTLNVEKFEDVNLVQEAVQRCLKDQTITEEYRKEVVDECMQDIVKELGSYICGTRIYDYTDLKNWIMENGDLDSVGQSYIEDALRGTDYDSLDELIDAVDSMSRNLEAIGNLARDITDYVADSGC